MRYVWIAGKPYLWDDLLKQRRAEREANKKRQLTLFELKDDTRPKSQQSADGRYTEPTLFENPRHES